MGYVYGEKENNQYFDAKRGIIFELEAARLGHPTAQYNLGIGAQRGFERKVSLEEAEYWFALSAEQGYGYAIGQLARLRIRYPQYYLSEDKKNPDKFKALYGKYSIDASTPPPEKLRFLVNELLLACNKGDYRSGLTLYERAEKNLYEPQSTYPVAQAKYELLDWFSTQVGKISGDTIAESSCFQLALMHFLGIDAERSDQKAQEYLNKIPVQSNHIYVRHVLSKMKHKLQYIIEESEENPEYYNGMIDFIANIYHSHGGTAVFAERLSRGEIESKAPLTHILWATSTLASLQKKDANQWRDLLAKAEAIRLGLILKQMKHSALITGPMYNNISPDTGLPILGHIKPSAKDERTAREQFNRAGMFVPAPGIVHLRGIKAFSNGTFQLDVVSTEGTPSAKPAMILDEDIEVALVLMFGERLHIGEIFLSLENPRNENVIESYDQEIDLIYGSFSYKLWHPKWLGHTHMGRTLCTTDNLIGAICGTPEEFETAKICDSKQLPHLISDLIEDIRLTGGRDGDGESARVMIRPEEQVIIRTDKRRNQTDIKIIDFRMKVDGAYILGKNRSIVQNDTDYRQGRVCKKLGERFMDIATLMPVFERGRQLAAMLYAFNELRHSGWQPSKELQTSIDTAHKHYKSLPNLPLSELMMKPVPFAYKKF